MSRFLYQARDAQGEMISGALSAGTLAEAGQLVRKEGKFVVNIEQDHGDADDTEDAPLQERARRVKRDEVIQFAHQMAVMMETGVPLGEALGSITDQAGKTDFAAVLEDVSHTVQGGSPFSVALGRHPHVFPKLMVSLLRASEASGTMSQMLERISRYLAKERQTLKKIRGALTYPTFMVLMALTVTVFLLTFVLPRFATIYENRGATLPLPTRMLLGTSTITVQYWYIWLTLLVAAVGGVIWFRRTPQGRRTLDWCKISLPLLGDMFRQLYITRATRTMGTMITAGVPMLDMIAIVREVTNNVHYEELWGEVDERLKQGAQLSEPLFDSDLIPRTMARMISAGEKAGRLGQVMDRIAEFAEEDFDESVKRATQFIEPVMISFMGGIIGVVAISLLLPIFSISKVMAG